jgi:hypothetical protein
VEGGGFFPNLSTLLPFFPLLLLSAFDFLASQKCLASNRSPSASVCVCMGGASEGMDMDSIKFPPDGSPSPPLSFTSLHSIPPFPSSNFNLPFPPHLPAIFPDSGGRTTFHIVISFSSSGCCCCCSWKDGEKAPHQCVCINWENWMQANAGEDE